MEIKVKVAPRSRTSQVTGSLPDGTLKVKVAAAPEKGKANAELREVLAAYYGVPVRDVEILSGASTRLKRVRIHRG